MIEPIKTEASTIWKIPGTILELRSQFVAKNHCYPNVMLCGRRVWWEIVQYKTHNNPELNDNYSYMLMKMVPDESIDERAIELS